MEIIALEIDGVFEIRPKIIGDDRGFFAETYRAEKMLAHGMETNWAQENQSFTAAKGTIRGLHFQRPPFEQAKFVRAISGSIRDVFVDIRRDSATYGKWGAIILSAEKLNSVYIPAGFAHGFCTETEDTIVQYKVSHEYSFEHDDGIRWDDKDIGIVWGVENPKLSEKDRGLGKFRELDSPF